MVSFCAILEKLTGGHLACFDFRDNRGELITCNAIRMVFRSMYNRLFSAASNSEFMI
jgi:hypothetical protein